MTLGFPQPLETSLTLPCTCCIASQVSTKLAKKVYALVDVNGDGVADNMTVLVDGIDTPQGIDWHKWV